MKKIYENKYASSILILIVYIVSFLPSYILYQNLNVSLWLNLLICDVTATTICFIFSLLLKNSSVYDPYWSVLPLIVIPFYYFSYEKTLISTLIMIAVSLWGLRLTYNWFYTFKGLSHQDWRYTMLKEKSGKLYFFVNYFGIHMFPTLVVYLCILPAVLAIVNVVEFNFIAIIGFILCLIGVSLELFADISMQKHRKNGSGNLIRNGLWKYSRHPNYLGEITMWFGIMLLSIMVVKESPYLVMGAIINMLMFIFISIPMADKRQSQKEGYDLYKEETRMLLPVPKFKK